ncbi:divalent-cation tolerance protein CutA [Actinomadura darangshiensis]|uniref:Divalent-cation tolerance protein CutA n=1 Tax=Actinomadura darangshiensis TaxID=705336 RepID=A0A4R4ZSE8_9ACTN|nr:divalent-cation tolerance protein CutA [Actinomadura darangshiensis]TDD61961.1 divalent-cation tolerance protein CutA [Actinomadura darangshiensis]
MTDSQPLLVFTATPDREAGMVLLKSAVASHLAASGQVVGPAGNVFWHLGELGTGEEWQVSLRTTSERYAELETHLLERHPWDNPEIMYVVVGGGSQACLEWLKRETRTSP